MKFMHMFPKAPENERSQITEIQHHAGESLWQKERYQAAEALRDLMPHRLYGEYDWKAKMSCLFTLNFSSRCQQAVQEPEKALMWKPKGKEENSWTLLCESQVSLLLPVQFHATLSKPNVLIGRERMFQEKMDFYPSDYLK